MSKVDFSDDDVPLLELKLKPKPKPNRKRKRAKNEEEKEKKEKAPRKKKQKQEEKEESESILHLTLIRKWFAAIAAGTKVVEYRDIKPHWTIRLENRHYDVIKFRNGYSAEAPEMLVKCLGVSQENGKYAIRLGKILDVKNWPVV